MALSSYDRQTLSTAQQKGIEAATKAWNDANARGDKAGMAAAHAQAESIRNNAGYTSDTWGRYSGSTPTATSSISIDERGNVRGTDTSGRSYSYVDQDVAQRYQQHQAEVWQQELQDLYNGQQSQYAQALAQQKAAQEAAVQQAVNRLESQKADTDQRYSELFRQLYIDKMSNRKNLDQRLAASGVTGGAAESTALGYDSAYEDALRQGEQGRIGALSDLDRAITDTRLTGDIESARSAADSIRKQADNYAGTLKDLISRYDTLNARKEADEREDALRSEKYAREETTAARTWARQLVNQYIAGKQMPPADILESAGMDAATARSLIAIKAQEEEREKAEAEAKAAAQAGKPLLTAAQVNAAIKNGIRTPEVLAAYEYYYGAPYRG